MSEEKGIYETVADQLAENGYIEDAVEMLGKGYDNAAEIHPPKKINAIGERGLTEVSVWGWVKTSATFIHHIKKLKGAKLAIWHVISLSIDVDGICNLSIREIADLAGYSYSETHQSLKELDAMGYLSVDKEKGRKSLYSPSFTARGTNQPTDNPSRKTRGQEDTPLQPTGDDPSSPPIEKAHSSIKELKELRDSPSKTKKKGDPVDGMLFYGKQALEQGVDKVEELLCEIERGIKVNLQRSNDNQIIARKILKDGRSFGEWLTWRIQDEWWAARLYIFADLTKIWEQWPAAWAKAESKPEHRPNYTTIEQLDEAAKGAVPRPDHIRPKSIGARR